MYPPMVTNDSIMSLQKFGTSSSSQNRLPIVRAITFLRKDATSEIIELNKFSEKCTSIAKYVSIFDFLDFVIFFCSFLSSYNQKNKKAVTFIIEIKKEILK